MARPMSVRLVVAAAAIAAGAVLIGATPAAAGAQTALPTGTPAGIAKAKADSARYPYTAADVQFMSGMIGHHAQAVVMATMAPSHGAAPMVRTLASRIINAQNDEIVLMQSWLADRLQRVPEAKAGPMKMQMNGMEHQMLMPGMLTEAQMQVLEGSRGADFDRNFLTFMIQHHNGAVSMVKELYAGYGSAQDELVFKFSSDVNVDQTTEIARMEKMLAALRGEKSAP